MNMGMGLLVIKCDELEKKGRQDDRDIKEAQTQVESSALLLQ